VSQAEEEQSPLPAHEEAALLAALEAALRPGELPAEVNERLIELALEDPLAAPTEQELAESVRLRDALAQSTSHEDAAMLGALRAPFAGPRDEDVAAAERVLDSALRAAPKRAHGRPNVIYAVFGTAGAALAAAAAVVLLAGTLSRGSAPAATGAEATALIKPRSTAPLFDDRFETGDTTARMDLIASSRGRDLRDNRYAAWGVR